MKTSELSGALLDYWVAKIEGVPENSTLRAMAVAIGSIESYTPKYSTNWADAGPIIEREHIAIDYVWRDSAADRRAWEAWAYKGRHYWDGDTPLIAAMRAYVGSVYGDEVPNEI